MCRDTQMTLEGGNAPPRLPDQAGERVCDLPLIAGQHVTVTVIATTGLAWPRRCDTTCTGSRASSSPLNDPVSIERAPDRSAGRGSTLHGSGPSSTGSRGGYAAGGFVTPARTSTGADHLPAGDRREAILAFIREHPGEITRDVAVLLGRGTLSRSQSKAADQADAALAAAATGQRRPGQTRTRTASAWQSCTSHTTARARPARTGRNPVTARIRSYTTCGSPRVHSHRGYRTGRGNHAGFAACRARCRRRDRPGPRRADLARHPGGHPLHRLHVGFLRPLRQHSPVPRRSCAR